MKSYKNFISEMIQNDSAKTSSLKNFITKDLRNKKKSFMPPLVKYLKGVTGSEVIPTMTNDYSSMPKNAGMTIEFTNKDKTVLLTLNIVSDSVAGIIKDYPDFENKLSYTVTITTKVKRDGKIYPVIKKDVVLNPGDTLNMLGKPESLFPKAKV
jgi:hypothetical protein